MTGNTLYPVKKYTEETEPIDINLNWPERYISIATGVKLTFSGLGGLFSSPLTSILKLGAGGYLLNRGVSGHCAIYSRIGKNTQEPVNVNIRSAFTINKPREAVYNFWRQLDNLPLFMNHLESVELIDDTRSHWVMKLPTGVGTISWDAEIVADKPGEVIGWSSLPDSVIDNAGKVFFRDAQDGKGTVVDVLITYQPPAGGLGASVANLLNPFFKNIVDNDVRNFKQYMDLENSLKPVAKNGHPHKSAAKKHVAAKH
ncbi:SRPBCC family protein [Mucilaginibacter sp. dw_454]|uniref:SRPBCC family protein n=1 Tax=Mucilaginibacter sp. dw_454 TaxID=2720079 RepID=UPI001BD69FA9|nr:SRPBCC family protein [Mucilaginibacter sp. dw_454]